MRIEQKVKKRNCWIKLPFVCVFFVCVCVAALSILFFSLRLSFSIVFVVMPVIQSFSSFCQRQLICTIFFFSLNKIFSCEFCAKFAFLCGCFLCTHSRITLLIRVVKRSPCSFLFVCVCAFFSTPQFPIQFAKTFGNWINAE